MPKKKPEYGARFEIRLPPWQLSWIKHVAVDANLSISDWAREALANAYKTSRVPGQRKLEKDKFDAQFMPDATPAKWMVDAKERALARKNYAHGPNGMAAY